MPVEVRTLADWEADCLPGVLSVLIPAHNEEGRIEATVREIHVALAAAAIPHEILVVNDNSRDQTENVLKRLGQEIRELRYVNNQPPNGFGFAVRTGLVSFRGDAVAIVMADSSDSRMISWRTTARCRRASNASSDPVSCEARRWWTTRGRS